MPAGLPKIEVEFLIDHNGILHVSACEVRSGRQAAIQVVPAHGLTAEEVERMEVESYRFAREDMAAHRLIDLRNQVVFDVEKTRQMLRRAGDRLGAEERERIEAAMESLAGLAETETDPDRLHRALSEFGRLTVHLAEIAVRTALEADGAP